MNDQLIGEQGLLKEELVALLDDINLGLGILRCPGLFGAGAVHRQRTDWYREA